MKTEPLANKPHPILIPLRINNNVVIALLESTKSCIPTRMIELTRDEAVRLRDGITLTLGELKPTTPPTPPYC